MYDNQEEREASQCLLDIQLNTSWKIRDEFKYMYNKPHILDVIATLFTLINDDRLSIARIADGEFGLMTGVDLPTAKYQGHSLSLRKSLANILKCEKKLCRVALPKWFIYKSEPIQAYNADKFSYNWSSKASEGRYFDFFNPGYLYLDACMSVPRAHYGSLGPDFINAYYFFARRLIADKDIILVTGDTRYLTMEHKFIHENVRSVTVHSVPPREAWSSYEETKNNLLKLNPKGEKTVVLCCGPMAAVLAYELSDEMRCLDLGHMLVDYNLAKGGYGTGNFWH